MNEEILLEKLRRKLHDPIHTEEQALFVLIAARKLIELGGYGKTELLAGRFMTDWAVHSVVDRNSWSRESLAYMDAIFEQNKFWNQLTAEEQQRFAAILSLEKGRIDLMNVFRNAHVNPIAFGHPIGWRVFLDAFLELINDCPMKLTHGRVIDSVTMSMLPDPLHTSRLYISWKFMRIDGQEPFVITLPMIAEKPTFHFGRGGKASDNSFEAKLQALGYQLS